MPAKAKSIIAAQETEDQQRQYSIYIHINPLDNNKVYIGLTKQKVQNRWSNGQGYKKCTYFNRAIEKYGWKNFQHKILFQHLTKEQAELKEKELIKEYQATNPTKGYNIQSGGATGPRDFSKMIEWSRTHKIFGEDRYNAKKVRCIETGDVFGSITQAERWCNSAKVGECCRGERKKAGKHPQTGIPLTWQFALNNEKVTIICHEKIESPFTKNSGGSPKKVICKNTSQTFNTIRQAANWCNLKDTANISRCCRGLRKTAGKHPETNEKLQWQYIL